MASRLQCPRCGEQDNQPTATNCRFCGSELPPLPKAALDLAQQQDWNSRAGRVALATTVGLLALVGVLIADHKADRKAGPTSQAEALISKPTVAELAAERQQDIAATKAFLEGPREEIEKGIEQCESEIVDALSNKLTHMLVGTTSDAIDDARKAAKYDLNLGANSYMLDERIVKRDVCSFSNTGFGRQVRLHSMGCRFQGTRYVGLQADMPGTPVPEGWAYACDGLGL